MFFGGEMPDFLELERRLVSRNVLDALYSQSGIDVVPARAEYFLNRVGHDYTFDFLSKGKSRYVYAINKPGMDIGLVLKLGAKAQNNLEVKNTLAHPEDLPRIYGAFDYALVAERADMVDRFDSDPRMKLPDNEAKFLELKHRYGDVGSNIGFVGDRMVMVDGGVNARD
jgi:hypothetical protein